MNYVYEYVLVISQNVVICNVHSMTKSNCLYEIMYCTAPRKYNYCTGKHQGHDMILKMLQTLAPTVVNCTIYSTLHISRNEPCCLFFQFRLKSSKGAILQINTIRVTTLVFEGLGVRCDFSLLSCHFQIKC